jgi:alkanesulfonate monooxygenase SsuD/methylene tetrahydromethanopterin reductase-like flavin-dependent oxidoreductase (luciferase family)
MVARYATEWNAPIMGGLDVFKQKSQVLERHCEAEKRDPKTIDRSVMTSYISGENQAEVDSKIKAAIENAPPRFRSNDPNRPPMTALWGTPPQIVEQIKEIEDAGISRIMLQYRTPPARADLEFVAQELLPKV